MTLELELGRPVGPLGATREACAVVDTIVVRESSGDPCAVHVLGPGEYGLGLGRVSVGLHLAKWDSTADPAVLRVPEVATVVIVRLLRRAVSRYRARSWRRVGSVYAGRLRPQDYDRGRDARWCSRLARRGIDCDADPRGQLGRVLGRGPVEGQEAWVLARMTP